MSSWRKKDDVRVVELDGEVSCVHWKDCTLWDNTSPPALCPVTVYKAVVGAAFPASTSSQCATSGNGLKLPRSLAFTAA